MRRHHVYERSAPRAARSSHLDPEADAVATARSIARALPALIDRAEAGRLSIMAQQLAKALRLAERIAAAPDRSGEDTP